MEFLFCLPVISRKNVIAAVAVKILKPQALCRTGSGLRRLLLQTGSGDKQSGKVQWGNNRDSCPVSQYEYVTVDAGGEMEGWAMILQR